MVNKKDKKRLTMLLLIGGIILLFIFLKPAKDIGVQDKGVSLKVFVYDRDKNLIGELQTIGRGPLMATVTFPGGEPIENIAFITIESTITNIEGNVIIDITDIDATNSPGPNLYGLAIAGYSKVFELDVGESNIQISDFIDVDELTLGEVEFRMDTTAHFFDAEGNRVDASTFGTIIIMIESDLCLDGTPVGECTDDGRLCMEYQTDPVYDEGCCIQAGGRWDEDTQTCDIGCGNIPIGGCDTAPDDLPSRNTYCDPNTSMMIESCSTCHCYDYYGNQELSCSDDICVFQEYNGTLSIDLGAPIDQCECTEWIDDSCGGNDCFPFRMHQTRTCNPSGCDIESKCVASSICWPSP